MIPHFFNYTAIIVPSDIAGEKVYKILMDNKIKIGSDVSVVSLGGTSIADKLSPKLTTVYQDYIKIGEEAVELLNLQLCDHPSQTHTSIVDYNIIATDSLQKI